MIRDHSSLSMRIKYLQNLNLLRRNPSKLSERLNLFHQFKLFSQRCTSSFAFWSLVAVCAAAEPICCSYYPTVLNLFVQAVILAMSTFLYLVQLTGVASTEWEKIIVIEALSGFESVNINKAVKDFTPLKLLVFFTAEGEYILEGFMLTVGWILIFWHPGLAALRCFRVFRLLWFYEVEIFRHNMITYLSPILGVTFMDRFFKVLKFSIKSLSALGNEMFRLTNETRGGLFLMVLFFYSAYVLGITLWIETAGEFDNCYSGPSCTYTLMRLTFYDGNGFDFAFSLTNRHQILFVIVIGYLCITAFGILNGLVGIFGNAFTRASHMAFNEDTRHTEDDEELDEDEAAQIGLGNDNSSIGGGGNDDGSVGGGGGGKNGDTNSGSSSPTKSRNNNNNNNKYNNIEPTQEGENEDGSISSESESEDRRKNTNIFSANNDDSSVQTFEPVNSIQKEGGTSGGKGGDENVHAFEAQKDIPSLMIAAKLVSARNLLDPNNSPMDRTEIKQKVKQIFRGNSSRFAVEHVRRAQKQQFQQQQQQQQQAAVAAASGLNLRSLVAGNTATAAANNNNATTATATTSGSNLSSLIPGPPISSPTSSSVASNNNNKKFNLRDIVRRASQQSPSTAEIYPMDGLFGGGYGSSSPSPYRPKASRMNDGGFGANSSAMNLKPVNSTASLLNTVGALTQSNQSVNVLTTQMQEMQKDMKSMTQTMQEMHRVFDRQHDMIFHMYQHINYLSHQLQIIHPEAKIDDKLPEFSIDMKKYKGPIITAPPPSQPKVNTNMNPAMVAPMPMPSPSSLPPRGLQNYVHRVQHSAKAAGVGPPPLIPHTALSTTTEETSTSVQLFEASTRTNDSNR